MKSLWVLLLAGLMLSGCGGSSRSSSSQNSAPLAGNWQFTLASPSDGSFVGSPNAACTLTPGTPLPICSGGFLLQNKSSITGAVVYAIELPPPPNTTLPTLCNSGSAPITGTINGQNVTFTALAGIQTFTLTGTLSPDGSTMMGTYVSTDGKGCGTAQAGLQWSATSVKPLTGPVQGIFHSAAGRFQTPSGDTLVISNQNFPVTGVLTQGANIGASNATVTGTLTFQGYPCLDTASVNGQISGNSVILQIIATNGLKAGQIGSPGRATDTVSPVVFQSTAQGGYVLKGASEEHLVHALREAAAGRRWLSPPITELAIDAYIEQMKAGPLDPHERLTAREREVLHLAAEGNTCSKIAARLHISHRTVENHRARLMRKLGLQNQSELVRYAMQRGMLCSGE